MRDRNYKTKHGFVNMHRTRGSKSTAYGDDLIQKNFLQKVTDNQLRVDKST